MLGKSWVLDLLCCTSIETVGFYSPAISPKAKLNSTIFKAAFYFALPKNKNRQHIFTISHKISLQLLSTMETTSKKTLGRKKFTLGNGSQPWFSLFSKGMTVSTGFLSFSSPWLPQVFWPVSFNTVHTLSNLSFHSCWAYLICFNVCFILSALILNLNRKNCFFIINHKNRHSNNTSNKAQILELY